MIRPVYAPALVAFVGPGISVSISAGPPVAWFPLGPREPYFPWYHHTDVYLRQVNVTNVRNVTNITNIVSVTNVRNITYVNRTVATTAVSSDAFRRGEPVERQIVRVDRDQIARAQVIPHPEITPEARAIAAGAQQVHPPVENRRPTVVYRPPVRPGTPQEQARNVEPQVTAGPRPRNNREVRPGPQAPVQEPQRENPQETGRSFPERGNAQAEQPRPQAEQARPQPPNGGAENNRPLFTRNTPPPERPAFEPRDPEFPPHPEPARPAPRQR